MKLQDVFLPDTIIMNLESQTKDELFEEMVQTLVKFHPQVDRDLALKSILERESQMTTGILPSMGVPHGHIPGIEGAYGVIGISQAGIDYDSLDKQPVNFVFLIVCNSEDTVTHLNVLKDLALLLKNPEFLPSLKSAKTPKEIFDLLG